MTMAYNPWHHLYNIGVATSQWLNATLLAGDPDESISGRAGKGREAGSPAWTLVATIIDFLWWPIERDHCANSIERDRGQAAAFLRKTA